MNPIETLIAPCVVWQGSSPHGTTQLGLGTSMIGRAGCLMECLGLTAVGLKSARAPVIVGKGFSMMLLNAKLKERAGAFAGSSLVMPKAAPVVGLTFVDIEHPSRAKLIAAVDAGTPVVLGVDFEAGASSGASDADHFVTLVDYHEGDFRWIRFADPAYGRVAQYDVREGPDDEIVFEYRGNPAARIAEARFFALDPALQGTT